MIEWHRVTWYSKLVAVLFFIGILPVWTFYMGTQYEKTREVLEEADLGQISYYNVPKTTQSKPTTTPSTNPTSSGTGTTKDSGVEGIVTIGPTCPVVMPDNPNCDDKPYETTLVIASTQIGKNGGIMVKTDAQGHYKATLAPGKYTIRAQSTAILPRLEPITFLVLDNKYTELNFSFDSGIR